MIRIENQQCRVQTVNSNKKLVQIKLSSTPVYYMMTNTGITCV